jgi:hypothetical protein
VGLFTRAGVGILLLVGLGGLGATARAQGNELPTLELRVITYGSQDRAGIDCARQTALDILKSAGLRVEWRECSGDSCTAPAEGRFILVRLLPIASRSNAATSGEVVRHPVTGIPSIVVYVPRNAEIAQTVRRRGADGSNAVLATITTGHLNGLAIAHEIGHVMGLRHRSSGPMKSKPDTGDMIALRGLALRFEPAEIEAIRLALRTAVVPVVARGGVRQ